MPALLHGTGALFLSANCPRSSFALVLNKSIVKSLLLRRRSLPSEELDCVHFESCSGCTVQTELSQPSSRLIAETYFSSFGIQFTFHAASLYSWRQRARLAVQRGSGGRPIIGLFQQGSHTAVDIPSCVAHNPAINHAAEIVRQCVEDCNIRIYDEVSGKGDLRYLQLTVVESQHSDSMHSPSVQVVLVWNSSPDSALSIKRLRRLAGNIYARAGISVQHKPDSQQDVLFHSIWSNYQPKKTNTILASAPESWSLLYGLEHAWVRLGGADIFFTPGSFLQANFEAMDQCLKVMQLIVPRSATIVDLHAGVGTIGLSLAATRQPHWVRFVEINPLAEAPFRLSAARLIASIEEQREAEERRSGGRSLEIDQSSLQLEYHVAAAGSDPGRWLEGAQIVIVDPPRKGLEPLLIQYLSSREAMVKHPEVNKLLYLSCGFPSFTRDCDQLLASNQWELEHAQGFLFFPGTNHIETLAVFRRIGD